MDYLYDGNGILYGLIYNGNKYFYLRDHLANILGIIDSSGNLVVSYDYYAYGKIKSITGSMASTLGQDNHMRYKGYYFDEETGFYYCKSRYYVPEWCRWLNADSPAYLKPYSATGNNLFAYCSNDPVNRADYSGAVWTKIKNWFSNVFGARTEVVSSTIKEKDQFGFPGWLEYKKQEIETDLISSKGDSTKLTSVYAVLDVGDLFSSSAGIKLNIYNCTVDVKLSVRDLGVSFYFKDDEYTYGSGLSADLVGFDLVGYGFRSTQDEDKRETIKYSTSVDGRLLLAVVTLKSKAMSTIYKLARAF